MKYIKTTLNNIFMSLAKEQSLLATDLRKSTGVVIVENGQVVGKGFNQATLKWKWLIELHKTYCLRKILKFSKNNHYWVCPGCALFKNHGEIRAIKSLKETTGKYDLYLYGHDYCCNNCLNEIKKLNIENIYILK